MSPAQETLHWRRWGVVVRANGWRMKGGRLVDDAAGSRVRSEHHRLVWTYAEQLALKAHRAVTPDDLRHATYCVAAGRDCSHSDLTNAEFNRLLSLWQLLADPDNLHAVMEWDHPDIAQRRAQVASILRKASRAGVGEAYVIAVARNKFGTADWRDLGLRQLQQLGFTMSGVARKKHPQTVASNDPF